MTVITGRGTSRVGGSRPRGEVTMACKSKGGAKKPAPKKTASAAKKPKKK